LATKKLSITEMTCQGHSRSCDRPTTWLDRENAISY